MFCIVKKVGDEYGELYNQQELTIIQLRYVLFLRLCDCIAV